MNSPQEKFCGGFAVPGDEKRLGLHECHSCPGPKLARSLYYSYNATAEQYLGTVLHLLLG